MEEHKQETETVDFAYAIDCTGSMDPYIKQVKTDIDKVVSEMGQRFPEFKLRLACVAYRDWCDGADRLESLDFTKNVSSFKKFVGKLKATGGGDLAEDVLGGLQNAARLSWESELRVLFHICDAPPHNKIYHDIVSDNYPHGHPSDPKNYHQAVLKKFKENNINLCIAKLNSYVEKMIDIFKNYGKEIELNVEERNVPDASKLLWAVRQTLFLHAKMIKERKEIKSTETKIDNIQNELGTLEVKSDDFVETNQTMKKLEIIYKDIQDANTKIKKVLATVEETRKKYVELKSKYLVLTAYARDASTREEIEKAEKDVIKLNLNLVKLNENYSKAQDTLSQTMKDLAEKTADLDQKERTLEEKAKERARVKLEITNLISKLEKRAVTEETEVMREQIRSKFRNITKLFNDDAKVKGKIIAIRKAILKAVKEAAKGSKHIIECMRDLESKVAELDALLEKLEDKE